jgi:L-fucose isomerase-like protein
MQAAVRLGLVPSYRFEFSPWCKQMLDENALAIRSIAGVELVLPRVATAGQNDPLEGYVPYGAVHTLDEAEGLAEFYRSQKIDGLVICPLDFGDERSAVKVAEKLAVPVFIYATKEPPARDDATLLRVSDSYCGNLGIAAALNRRGISFRFGGIFFPSEPAFCAELRDFAQAVCVVKGLKGARFGQVGPRPEGFETVAYDEIALAEKFGQNVIFKSLNEIMSRANSFSAADPRLQAIIDDVRGNYAQITVAEDYFTKSARVELALVDFWETYRLSGLGCECWPNIREMANISVCSIFGRLTQRRMLTACEADVLGAASMLVSHCSTLRTQVPHFVDWTIQHRQNPNRLMAWHCGNAPLELACDPHKTALRSRLDMKGENPPQVGDYWSGLSQFQVKPGQVTFCRLAQLKGQWRMLIASGEIVPSDEVLNGTWAWVDVKDHARLYRTLVEKGFIHHASMMHGDQTHSLALACQFLGIEPIIEE